jgi:hypothetical protein
MMTIIIALVAFIVGVLISPLLIFYVIKNSEEKKK